MAASGLQFNRHRINFGLYHRYSCMNSYHAERRAYEVRKIEPLIVLVRRHRLT